jgi:hypothetical protein
MKIILKVLAVGAATTVFRIAAQMVMPEAEQNVLQPSIFVKNGTLPIVFSVYALFVYSILAAAFLIFDRGIGGGRIARGLKYGTALASIWAVFLFEQLPHGTSFLLDNVQYALIDAIALLLMGLLLGSLLTDKKYSDVVLRNEPSITTRIAPGKTVARVLIIAIAFVG